MKVIGLLFSLAFFAINCKSETIGVYNDLVHKLEKLESLSVEGLELFQKSQVIVNSSSNTTVDPFTNNEFAPKLQEFILKFEELGFTEQTELVNLIKTLGPNKYGLKYLIESKEEFNGLMHAINFYYDVLRDKLNDMCANNYCEIPEHLKINEEEIEMLKKVVLGYRKPIENIQDDIVKLEDYIARNKVTATTLTNLITEETNKITAKGEEDCDDTTCDSNKYTTKKAVYQAMYNVIFYKKQLAEVKKVIEVLEKRVSTLKKNDAIKPLLQQIEALKAPAVTAEEQIPAAGSSDGNTEETKQNTASEPVTEQVNTEQTGTGSTGTEPTNTVETVTTVTEGPSASVVPAVPALTDEEKAKKIAELYAQIKEIAKTIKFNLDGIFVDPIELEYYKKEKKNESCHLSASSCHTKKTPETVIPLNVRYPNGISYPLSEDVVYRKIANNDAETTYGDLTNLNGAPITEDLATNEQARKNLMKAIKKKIEIEEQKLVELKADYDTKLAAFNEQKTPFKTAADEFHKTKFRNKLTTEIFEAFKTKRTEYMTKKAQLEDCEYENAKKAINKLNKQLNYLQDYSLRKEIVNTEIEYFSNKKAELQYNINRLASAVQAKQNILVASKDIPLSTLVELQIQKSLLTKQIEQLNKTEVSLNKAHLKDKIYVPQTYGKEGKPEPYYLIAIKKEIDRLSKFIPKIDDMIEKEKQKMEQEPVATGESEQGTSDNSSGASTQTQAQTAQTAQTSQPAAAPAAPAPAENATETTTKTETATEGTTQGTQAAGTTSTDATVPTSPSPEAASTEEEAQPTESETPAETPAPAPTTPATPVVPAAPAAPAKPVMTKLYYLEKLKKFLAFSYSCHKYVLLQNSTINKDALSKYALTPEEDKIRTLKRCSELDVLLAIQNNMPTMYSLYESVVDGLQNIYTELYEKEMMYHIYNLKDTNPAVKALLIKAGVIDPEPEPVAPVVPEAAQVTPVQQTTQETTPEAPVQQTTQEASQQESTPTQETTPEVTTPEVTTPGTTASEPTTPAASEAPESQETQKAASTGAEAAQPAPAGPAPAQSAPASPAAVSGQSASSEQGTAVRAESEDEMFVDDFELDNFYKSYLQQVDGNNTQFINFIKSKKELIKALTPEKVNQLYLDIAHLKELSEHYYNRYYKYKLKLERLYQKHEQITAANQKIREVSILKSRLLRRKKYINGTFYVLPGYANFFNKRREAEKQYVDNAIKNTDMLLKYYKARSKYFTSEAVPLKTLTKTSIDREANYLKIEKFRAYSRLELRLKKNINLGKERISYVSGGLHHVFEEFKELLENKNYIGKSNPENAPEVFKAFEQYKELLPKGVTIPAPVVAPTVTPVADTTTTPPANAPAAAAPTTEGGEGTQVTGSSDNDDDDIDQIASAQSTDTQETDILDAFKSEGEYIYTKSLGNTYKSFKKHMLKEFSLITEDIINGLNNKLEKRNDFLDVLSYELALFKDINTNKFIVKNPYQLLDNDKKDKQMVNLKYAIKGVSDDIDTVTDGIAFFNKMIELYKPQLNAVNEQIAAIGKETNENDEKKKYAPIFEDLKGLYETILEGAKEFSELLQHKLENYKIEKAGFDILMANLETYIKIDEKLEDFVESAEKNKHIASVALNNLNRSGLITEDESTKILAKMFNMDAMDLLDVKDNHVCVNTRNVPEFARCFKHDNGEEEWRCLLGYKKVNDKCEKDNNPTCTENNGGCDSKAECRETGEPKKIVCTCLDPTPNPYYDGIFCSSSGFMGLSIILIITLIVFNLF
ncbi:merozoite surface protein 1 [Plasmodium vinckei lentum]|uniref:Merozoite surface protein 1 n=1 Tax=Plasmodium vinckei lentum TaxID=138297 RepID=A0A6V7S4A0_PLAVN|nr:merozoite surface protein 1 [Plasmodium vinckei lentum]